jgi:hypothetical protein
MECLTVKGKTIPDCASDLNLDANPGKPEDPPVKRIFFSNIGWSSGLMELTLSRKASITERLDEPIL